MTVIIYQNKSEGNVLDKYITQVVQLTGTLREGTSVLNPTIVVESDEANIVWANYIYIVEWGRFYFVNEIANIRNSVWSFDCHVDVLMTYKNTIRQQSGIIARQEYLYNLYLDDDKFLVNAPRMIVTKAFPNRVPAGNVAGANSFILTLAGGADSSQT